VVGLTFPLSAVIIIFARSIMHIFGHDFERGWAILVIGTCGQLVNCAVGSVGYLLLMSGNQRRLVKIQMAMAAVMVALCLGLVPVWGIWGAAAAAAITNIGVNVWNLLAVRSLLKLSPYNRSYLKFVPAIGATLLLTLFLRFAMAGRLDWVIVAVAVLLAYGAFAAVMFATGLDADDRLVIDAVWARLRGNFRATSGPRP